MTDPEKRWDLVARAIAGRMADLGLTKAELSRASNISDTSLTKYLRGEPIVRRDKQRDLCRALEWEPGSIERILSGKDPDPSELYGIDGTDLMSVLRLMEYRSIDEKDRLRANRHLTDAITPSMAIATELPFMREVVKHLVAAVAMLLRERGDDPEAFGLYMDDGPEGEAFAEAHWRRYDERGGPHGFAGEPQPWIQLPSQNPDATVEALEDAATELEAEDAAGSAPRPPRSD